MRPGRGIAPATLSNDNVLYRHIEIFGTGPDRIPWDLTDRPSIATETDPKKRETIAQLLAEEEAKLKELEKREGKKT